jgi:hypothetical protein
MEVRRGSTRVSGSRGLRARLIFTWSSPIQPGLAAIVVMCWWLREVRPARERTSSRLMREFFR